MGLLGPNAAGDVLEPCRVQVCYLGLHFHPDNTDVAGVLVVAPAALLHP
jgi:hypothetical protein